MTTVRLACLALPLALLLSGCASTPAKRIEKNREFFDALPVAAQARIRGGQIDLGYTADMVRIALDEPQRKLVRRTATEGDTEIWLYIDTTTRYERQRADIDGMSISGPGGSRSFGGSAWINIMMEKDFIRIRVEFKDGRVALIEQLAPEEPKK